MKNFPMKIKSRKLLHFVECSGTSGNKKIVLFCSFSSPRWILRQDGQEIISYRFWISWESKSEGKAGREAKDLPSKHFAFGSLGIPRGSAIQVAKVFFLFILFELNIRRKIYRRGPEKLLGRNKFGNEALAKSVRSRKSNLLGRWAENVWKNFFIV